MKNPLAWVEIPVADMARAKTFYEVLLGVSMTDMQVPGYEAAGFPMHPGQQGITGALFKGDGYHPGDTGPVIYFDCADIDAAVTRATAAGAKVMLPKKDIGDPGFISWLWDTEGNRIALIESKIK